MERSTLLLRSAKLNLARKMQIIEMVERLKGQLKSTIHTILIGYVFSPEVEKYVQEKYPNLRLMKTYEFELNYRILKKKNIANKK